MTVVGVATTGPNLIDGSGRLVVIQDASGAVEIRLPAPGTAGAAGLAGHRIAPGARLQVSGTVGHAYGAPRISATSVTWLGSGLPPVPIRIAAAPGPGLEWRLVQASGRLDSVHRLGQRWRGELVVGSVRIPIAGLTGADIAVGRLLAGRRVTVVGIVRRPYPTAVDQRFAIDPRSVADLAFQPAAPAGPSGASSRPGVDGVGSSPGRPAGGPAGSPSASAPTIDLADLPSAAGRTVRVAGLVVDRAGSTISLDDGTTTGRLVLAGDALPFLDLIQVGDPIEATGLVSADPAGPYVLVTSSDGVIQAGDPDPSGPVGAAGSAAPGGDPGAAGGLPSPDRAAAATSSSPSEPGSPGGPAGSVAGLLGAALAVAIGLVAALAIALLSSRQGTRRRRSAGSDEAAPARATLGPS